ncbi:MAG: hypothetical protein EB059_09035 [Alphaproteobacteria bacterium]|nr:hypothetical protein [Alphaproteobacteria bacterium]
MKQDDKFDARIKAALHLQTPQALSGDFATRLRMEAERIGTPDLSGKIINHLPAPCAITHFQAMAAVLLFMVGLTFGTSHSPFTSTTSNTTHLDLYSFYDYSRGGIL